MSYPNTMPDLSDIVSGQALAHRTVDLLTGDRGRAYEDKAMMTNFARLVDLAVRDYQRIQAELQAHEPGNPVHLLIGCTSHLESCVFSTHRACRYAVELAKRQILDRSLIPPKGDRNAVKELRDAMEHTEDRLLGRRRPAVTQGQYSWVRPEHDDAFIGVHRLSWTQLARTIRALHDAALAPTG